MQKVSVVLVDDLDGTEGERGEILSVNFGIDGQQFEIDLCTENYDKLADLLAPYMGAGRRLKMGTVAKRSIGKGIQRRPAKRDPKQTKAIREWGIKNGWNCGTHGRFPDGMEEAFNEAHSTKRAATH